MAPNYSNGNTITGTNNIDVDLKVEQDLDRTWVDTNQSDEFHDDYEESQENSSLNTPSNVKFKVRTTYNEVIDDDKTERNDWVYKHDDSIWWQCRYRIVFKKTLCIRCIHGKIAAKTYYQ